MKRFLLIFCLGLILALSTSASPQTPVRCNNCGGSGGVVMGYNYYGQPVFGPCPICGGTGAVMVYPQPSPNSNNVVFKGDNSDGWIKDGSVTLTRVESKSTDTFDLYKKGSKRAVKSRGSYIEINSGKFVKINGIFYYAI